MSTVHAPCSGWPAKARLFTSTHAASSSAGDEGADGHAVRPAGRIGEREWHAHLQETAFGHEARAAARVVVDVVGTVHPVGDVTAALGRDDLEGAGEELVAHVGPAGPDRELE